MSVMTVDEGFQPYHAPPAALTTTALTGPDRLQVSDASGPLAMLTVGAKTVTMRGQQRTFLEQKRPFADGFNRTTATTWGVSPGGGTWSNSGGTEANYSVNGTAGVINMTTTNSSRHTSVINDLMDVNARLSWSLNVMPVGNASSLALSLAYASASNQYRARLSILTSGTVQLALEKEVGGTVTALGALTTIATGYTLGDVWHIRAERAGTTIRCRAWKDGSTEPTTWTHSVTDSDLGAGRVGVRGLASTGSTATPFNFLVQDFEVTSGAWLAPPTITHNQWVRVLPAPFSGTWTPALADQIRAWVTDTSPDALAYAMMYTTGAPTVTSPALGGAQIAGQCSYGPLDPAGHPIEGADFHDYMGVNWTFPNGETQAAGAGEAGCMDCSGYVRMVYGYYLGIPMVRNANFDGVNLPRQTKDIGPSGPGVIIAQSASSVPSMASMQIGDIVLFDADDSDATPGQIDHDGIYLGVDTAGHPRFANSRKTPNGPTFGDLGGSSALDGTGLYATTLRIIRRF